MKRDRDLRELRALLGDEAERRDLDAQPRDGWELRQRLWRELELPPVAPASPGFASRVLARARAEPQPLLGLPLSPGWARATAALLLVFGIAGGVGLEVVADSSPDGDTSFLAWSETTLAEEYLAGGDDLEESVLAPSTEVGR